MDGWVGTWVCGWMSGWMNGRVGRWVSGWTGGRMDGWSVWISQVYSAVYYMPYTMSHMLMGVKANAILWRTMFSKLLFEINF